MKTTKNLTFIERLTKDYSTESLLKINTFNDLELVKSIKDNLSLLFNSKRRCLSWDKIFELECSVLNYGLDDYSGILMNSRDSLEKIASLMEKMISFYEKRLINARVLLERTTDAKDSCVLFRIEGTIYKNESSRMIVYNAKLDKKNNRSIMVLDEMDSNVYV